MTSLFYLYQSSHLVSWTVLIEPRLWLRIYDLLNWRASKVPFFFMHQLQLVGTHIRYTNWHVNLFHYNYCVNNSHFRSQLEPMSFVWKLMVDHVHLNSVQFTTYSDGQCSIKWRFPPTSFSMLFQTRIPLVTRENQIKSKTSIEPRVLLIWRWGFDLSYYFSDLFIHLLLIVCLNESFLCLLLLFQRRHSR